MVVLYLCLSGRNPGTFCFVLIVWPFNRIPSGVRKPVAGVSDTRYGEYVLNETHEENPPRPVWSLQWQLAQYKGGIKRLLGGSKLVSVSKNGEPFDSSDRQ